MYVVTQSNKVINFDNCIRAEIHKLGPSSVFQQYELRLLSTIDNYTVYTGSKEDVESALHNFCEALAKGATLISYSEVYNDNMCGN